MKILGSDWDGTFTHGGVDDKKLLAVKKWREAGNKFGIVTGRGPDFRDRLIEYYPKFEYDFLATCNGGYVIDGSGRVLHKSSFESLDVRALVDDLFSWGCIFAHIVADEYACAITAPDARPEYIDPSRAFLLENLPNVKVVSDAGTVADFAKAHNVSYLLKGVRNEADFLYEREMADVNRSRGVETLLLPALPELREVSSSEVRRRLDGGKSKGDLLPPAVEAYLESISNKP